MSSPVSRPATRVVYVPAILLWVAFILNIIIVFTQWNRVDDGKQWILVAIMLVVLTFAIMMTQLGIHERRRNNR